MTDTDPLGRPYSAGAKCQYCGANHSTICHKIKRIEYGRDGINIFISAVELHGPQAFALEYADEDNDVMVSGSYDDVMRYQRERKMQ